MTRVYIVLLNWNGWRDTLDCLESLQYLDYSDYKLLVVDNASTDESVEKIKAAWPSVELLQTGLNLGFGGGCNVGIEYAMCRGADYVWLVNSDTVVDPGALSALVHKADQNRRLGSVGSVVYEIDETQKIQLWGGGKINLWTGSSRHLVSPGMPDFISGASILLRCTALEEVGLFDQKDFFMYWEDADLGFRLRQAGWGLAVAENSHIRHKQSASLGEGSPLLDQYFTQSGIRFLRRHAPVSWISISWLLSRLLVKRLALGNIQRLRAVLKGFWAA